MSLRRRFSGAYIANFAYTRARAAEAIGAQVEPAEFNEIIGELNNARSEALDLCDATY